MTRARRAEVVDKTAAPEPALRSTPAPMSDILAGSFRFPAHRACFGLSERFVPGDLGPDRITSLFYRLPCATIWTAHRCLTARPGAAASPGAISSPSP